MTFFARVQSFVCRSLLWFLKLANEYIKYDCHCFLPRAWAHVEQTEQLVQLYICNRLSTEMQSTLLAPQIPLEHLGVRQDFGGKLIEKCGFIELFSTMN